MQVPCKILQSGFITPDSSDLIQIPEEERSVVQAVLTQSIFRTDTSNFYDKGVQQLFITMAADPKIFSSFEYREAVLKKAISLFGESFSGNFIEWFRIQKESPAFSYLHQRYLHETLQFIFNRAPRKMSHNNYSRMLHVGANNAIFATSKEDTEAELNHCLTSLRSASVASLLESWTESVEGLQDMVATLHVIFGRRSAAAA